MAYFAGGATIGYFYYEWKKSKNKKGDGRWD